MSNIIVYVLDGCMACAETREYLRSKGIPFTEVNIRDDKSKALEMSKDGKTIETPIICETESNKCIVGFNEKAVDEIVGSP